MPGQTGPKTPSGKAVSSQNARKHGLRSRKVIVGEERQEDFDRLAAGWRAEYEPEGQAAESLMERVILNDWFLRRAEGQYMDAEAALEEVHPLERTAEQHEQVQLYLRYRTTAERSFYRAFYALRGLRKDKIKEELDLEKMRKKIGEMVRAEFAKMDDAPEVKPVAPEGGVSSGDVKKAAGTVAVSRARAVFRGQDHLKEIRKAGVSDRRVGRQGVQRMAVAAGAPGRSTKRSRLISAP